MRQYRDTREVKQLASRIGYRKKQYALNVTEKVTLQGLNWSGGSRTQYTAVSLYTHDSDTPVLSVAPPWNNPFEGATIEIPLGVVILEHGHFCGKPSVMVVHVRPENAPRLLEEQS
jgi:hypothetical protein